MNMIRRAAFLGSVFAAALATAACGSESDEASGGSSGTEGSGGASSSGSGGGPASGTGGSDPSCDTSATPNESSCVLTDELGIFVASSGDDGAPGTRDEPVKTLGHAIELAVSSKKRVYACAETFSEQVTVPGGVEIYGGLACDTDWSWTDGTPTDVTAAADAVPVMRLTAGDAKTVLSDLRISAAPAATPGGSSIAVIVDGGEAELFRCQLEAADAAHGAPGADHAGTGPAGIDGKVGNNADCDVSVSPGGAAVTNPACSESVGGKGGSSILTGTAGDPGLPALGGGQAGQGATTDEECTGGSAGAAGSAPANGGGTGANGKGSLDTAGYTGVAGNDGQAGLPGQGGGGGGGGRGCGLQQADDGGGSGGTGGCGGLGGRGGRPGGSSIALVVLDANVTLDSCTLIAGNGGNGGQGGTPQPGGPGGKGGSGANDNFLEVFNHTTWHGCGGGAGGAGGPGAAGGGGTGGHSLAIAFIGAAPVKVGGRYIYKANGTGGLGSGGAVANAGSDGIAAESEDFTVQQQQ